MPAVHAAGSPLVQIASNFAPLDLAVELKIASHSSRAFAVAGQAVTSSATTKASLRPQAAPVAA